MEEEKSKNHEKVKMFASCFMTDVSISHDEIVIEDSIRRQFFIDLKNASKELVDNFKTWFSDVYMACVPQVLTIVDYSIKPNADGESCRYVNRLVSKMMDDRHPVANEEK